MHFNFCAKIEQLFKKMPNFALFCSGTLRMLLSCK